MGPPLPKKLCAMTSFFGSFRTAYAEERLVRAYSLATFWCVCVCVWYEPCARATLDLVRAVHRKIVSKYGQFHIGGYQITIEAEHNKHPMRKPYEHMCSAISHNIKFSFPLVFVIMGQRRRRRFLYQQKQIIILLSSFGMECSTYTNRYRYIYHTIYRYISLGATFSV